VLLVISEHGRYGKQTNGRSNHPRNAGAEKRRDEKSRSMIDDKHTLHSRGHPDGSLETDHYVVSALICANLRKSVLFFKSHADFLVRRSLNRALRRSLAAAPKTVNQPNQKRNSTENEPNTLSPMNA
jgi:hypothetical protein